ncbi:MAG: hypothetical protein LBU76_07060 [Azoarcus sp.]|jgi:hypothetical protein|nr:hypothetical protein [Azoarcus sp.]
MLPVAPHVPALGLHALSLDDDAGRKRMVGIFMNTEEQIAEMLEPGCVWQATTAITANNVKVRIGGTGKKVRGMKRGSWAAHPMGERGSQLAAYVPQTLVRRKAVPR